MPASVASNHSNEDTNNSAANSPQIRSVPSFLNNDGIDELTPLQRRDRPSNLSLSDQWVGLNSAKNSFANLSAAAAAGGGGASSSNIAGKNKSRSSSFSLSRNPSLILKRQQKVSKIDHPRIANYAFAFDIDGVIVRGPETIPEAREALKMLNGANPYHIKVPYIFVTNGGGRSEKARCDELSKRLGIKIEENQVIQGHTPMKDLVSKFKTVLVVGGVGDACRKVAEGYGFKDVVTPLDIMKWKPSVTPYHTLTEDELKVARDRDFSKIKIDGICVFADSRNWAADQQIILELLLSKGGVMGTVSKTFDEGPPIYFAHSDFLWSTNYGLSRYGMGALQVSIAAIYGEHTGKELTVNRFGKPQRGTFRFADKVLNLWRKNKLQEHVTQELADLNINEEDEAEAAAEYKTAEEAEEAEEAQDKFPTGSDNKNNTPAANSGRPSIRSRLSTSKFQVNVDDSDSEDEYDSEDEEDNSQLAKNAAGQTPAETGDLILELPPSSTVYFVGDTPESDIRFANSHDATWHSILVKTGVYQEGTVPKYKPKHICENVLEAVKYAIEREHKLEVEEWNKNADELAKLKDVGGIASSNNHGSGLFNVGASHGNLNSLASTSRRPSNVGAGGPTSGVSVTKQNGGPPAQVNLNEKVNNVSNEKTGEAIYF